MTQLAQRHCQACEKGTPPLDASRTKHYLGEIPGWSVIGGKLTRDVKLKNFAQALDLVNRIGAVAESEGHHPDMCIHGWNQVRIDLVTHAIGGLSENDFILAAKVSALLET